MCQWKFKCPLTFEQLTKTESPTYRFCEQCQQNVYRCEDLKEAFEKAKQNRCIAIRIKNDKDNKVEELQGYLDIPRFLSSG